LGPEPGSTDNAGSVFDKGLAAYHRRAYESAELSFKEAANMYYCDQNVSGMNAALSNVKLSGCLNAKQSAENDSGSDDPLRSWEAALAKCRDFSDQTKEIQTAIDLARAEPAIKVNPSVSQAGNSPTSNGTNPVLSFDQYSLSGDRSRECGQNDELSGSLFDKGPVAYSCKSTELAHLQKSGEDQIRKFIGRACARGDTEQLAQHNAASLAHEMVFQAEIDMATELGAAPESNEIFVTNKSALNCVKL
jgi:hypothetical protein